MKCVKTSIIIFFILFLLFASQGYANQLEATGSNWFSILPPLLAVLLAFITRKLLLSLGIAIIVGAALMALRNSNENMLWLTIKTSSSYLLDNITNTWNLKVLAFVIVILSMISVIIVAGGLKGIVEHLHQYAKTPRSTKLVTIASGFIVFIDDYANTMIVGSAMRPITDQYKVCREKLAFIIDATSAPVAGLAIISTWIGFEVGLFGETANSLNIDKDGYSMFFDAFSYRFYCILMLLFVIANSLTQRDFGKMYQAESRCLKTGKLWADNANHEISSSFKLVKPQENINLRAKTAIIPFAFLFLFLIVGFWIDGNGYQYIQNSFFSLFSSEIWYNIISNTKNSTTVLLISAALSLVVAIIIAKFYAKATTNNLLQAIKTGVRSSFLPVMILLLAWSLKSVCDDLGTGKYVVDALTPHVSAWVFPAIVFIIAAITAFGTGTSWGTMSILIPIAIPVAYQLDGQTYGLITIICLGAVLDGAIFGDHCSPISDTTIMSSIASQCDHIDHVKTQIPYSLFVAAVALVIGYLPAALGMSSIVSYGVGLAIILAILIFYGKKITHEKQNSFPG